MTSTMPVARSHHRLDCDCAAALPMMVAKLLPSDALSAADCASAAAVNPSPPNTSTDSARVQKKRR